MENIDLWETYLKDKTDIEARNKIVEAYYFYAMKISLAYHKKVNQLVEYDDILSEAVFGLIEAVRKYDPEKKIKFTTFSTHFIKGRIIDSLRCLDIVPRSYRRVLKRVNGVKSEYGNGLSLDELSKLSGDSEKTIKRALDYDGLSEPVSLYKPIDEEGYTLLDQYIGDDGRLTFKDDFMKIVFKGLTKREKMVLYMYYYLGMSLKTIGKHIGLSESMTFQIRQSALKFLILRSNYLKERLYDSMPEKTGKLSVCK